LGRLAAWPKTRVNGSRQAKTKSSSFFMQPILRRPGLEATPN
jgi:hypothetical protein